MPKILVINPSTAYTRLEVFQDRQSLFFQKVEHDASLRAQCATFIEEEDLRFADIRRALLAYDSSLSVDVIVCRGALIRPLESGVYPITAAMCAEARAAARCHPVNLGVLLAYRLAQELEGCRAITANPGMVDERSELSRISGMPHIRRTAVWHVLNQKAVAQQFAEEVGRRYEDLNLIVCHLGMGVSIAAHEKGRAVDVNNAFDGEGAFSPMRSGTLPAGDLVRLCFSGKYTKEELIERITQKGGLMAHLGTSDVEAVAERAAQGDAQSQEVLSSMVYHIAKGIAAMGAVFSEKIDAILLTGDMAHCAPVVAGISERVGYLAPIHCYPGDKEMVALAAAALA